MRVSILVALLTILAPANGYSLVAQGPCIADTGVTCFDSSTFTDPTPLSPEVLKALLATNAAKSGLEYGGLSKEKDPSKWFRAREVNLGVPNEKDLIVSGVFPMSGADNDWFWLIRLKSSRPKVVLWMGGYTVELLKTQTNGFVDVRSSWNSPNDREVRTYRFNGSRYALYRDKWSKMPGTPY